MKTLAEISKADLIQVAKFQGFENKGSDMVHLFLDKEGEVLTNNHKAGVFKLRPETLEFLNSKYDLTPTL